MRRAFGSLMLALWCGACGNSPTSPGSLLGIYDLQEIQIFSGNSSSVLNVLKPPDATGRIVLQEDKTYSFLLIIVPGKTTFGTGFEGKGTYVATSMDMAFATAEGPALTTQSYAFREKRVELSANLHGTDVRMTFVHI
ncbi:hypothetical protein HYY27_08730 [bacterium]|nr:hypothetical protein [bacterium]